MKMNAFIDKFIPVASFSDDEQLSRRRLQTAISLIALLFSLVFSTAGFLTGLYISSVLLIFSTLLAAVSLYRIRLGLKPQKTLFMVLTICAFCVYIIIIETGIYKTAMIGWLVLIPITCVMFLKRWAKLALWVNITFLAVVVTLWRFGIYYNKQFTNEQEMFLSVIYSMGLVLIVYWFGTAFDRHRYETVLKLMRVKESKDELTKAMDELKQAKSQLVQTEKLAAIGELTAGIAHEINNPINFVKGNVGPLKSNLMQLRNVTFKMQEEIDRVGDATSIETIKKYKEEIEYQYLAEETYMLLNGIEEGANRTAEIVKGLRNFSRLDESEMKMANINECLDSTLILLNNKLKKQHIALEKKYEELPSIMCYPGQLNQVFMNIIGNAIHAIQEKGKITLVTHADKDNIHISIADTGEGMSEEIKEKIFQPFFTTKAVGEGTGLGLSITYGIIKKHNGSIEVQSELGKGTTFNIIIPKK